MYCKSTLTTYQSASYVSTCYLLACVKCGCTVHIACECLYHVPSIPFHFVHCIILVYCGSLRIIVTTIGRDWSDEACNYTRHNNNFLRFLPIMDTKSLILLLFELYMYVLT